MKEFRQKDVNAVKTFRENLVLAAHKICGINVPWWQRHWFDGVDKASISYIVGSRGAGKTFFIALYCVLRAVLFPKERVGVISNSYRQAQMIFQHVVDIIESGPHLVNSIDGNISMGTNECKVKFTNNSSIRALPLGDGSKIRSARFHTLVVDEFQDINQEIVDSVILPFLNVKKNPVSGMLVERGEKSGNKNKNRLIITSTAKYKYNDAYTKYAFIKERYEAKDPNYFHSVINLDDLRTVGGWVNEEVIALEKQTMSNVLFLMENYGVWAEVGDGFFDPMKCEEMKDVDVKFLDAPRDGCNYTIGVDPAKSSANFAIVVLEWDGEKTSLVNIDTFGQDELEMALDTIKHWQHTFNATVYIDARGGGIWISDELMKTDVGSSAGEVRITKGVPAERLIMVQTAHPLIDNMNWGLKSAIENNKIKVPAVVDANFQNTAEVMLADKRTNEINALIKELQSIIQKKLEKEVRYTTENDRMLKDRYCAVLYAYWGILENFIQTPQVEDDFAIGVV